MELIDVHAHLFDKHLPVTAAEAVANAQAAGVVQCVVPGLDVVTSREAIKIAGQFPGVCFATVGVYPSEVLVEGFELQATIESLQVLLAHDSPPPSRSRSQATNTSKEIPNRAAASTSHYQRGTSHSVVGIGEIGIDYYHHDREETGPAQRAAFAAQLQLGIDHDLPIIVHGRQAYADVLDVIRAHPGSRGLLHSFEAPYEIARQALDLGWVISLTALITYPGSAALRDVVRRLPLDRLTVETDAPYLPPQSIRDRNKESGKRNNGTLTPSSSFLLPHSKPVVGKRGINNQPAYMVETAQVLADLQGVSLGEVARATTATARQLFQLPSFNLSSWRG